MRFCRRRFSLRPVVCVASILFLAALFAVRSTVLQAQTPAASSSAGGDATFRAGTQEVLVDVVVVDKKGNVQRDLTRQDFKIWEDGKEQKITSVARPAFECASSA